MKTGDRLLSLDFFRGLTMFLLIAEFAHIFPYLLAPEVEGTLLWKLGQQLHHCEWAGLHFWDLIQPFFMFIVGVAMPYSFKNRRARGSSEKDIFKHVFIRSILLLFIGWALYCIGPGKIVFRFQNVLAQLGITYFMAWLIINKKAWFQILFTLLLLLITEGFYRFFPLEGFNEAFVPGKNFGAWFNILIDGREDPGHWAMFNAIPTAAHTIWGVLVGKLLLNSKPAYDKIKTLLIAAVVLLVVGYATSLATPIIKRISTSSFVLVSGGYTLLVMTLCYWIIDILKLRKGVWLFSIIGMNPLFIYLFSHVGGAKLVRQIVFPFTSGLTGWISEWFAGLFTGLVTLALLWGICYWLYRKKIFIRI
ncbi:MAG: DUF5009 domain-containing protein [Bacteroidetes bacterium]|nr:DUF5009 domain-containing protein [Bacteroidota bacterium]